MMKNTKISRLLVLLLIVMSTSGYSDSPVNPQPEPNGLRELADKCDIKLGTIVDSLAADVNSLERPLVTQNFNKVVSEAFHWARIRPDKNTYDFKWPDLQFELALENNMDEIEIHHLLWAALLPAWLTEGNYTRDELIEILREHILTVVGRYKDKEIRITYSVVNEIYSIEKFAPERNFWLRKIGPEVIEMAFRWAREADPNAILIWNDAYNEDRADPTRKMISDLTYDKIKELKSKGVPIDGVGMQMHLRSPFNPTEMPDPKKADVIENMKRFGELGLKIYITEFDVYLRDLKENMTQEERWDYQATLYGDMLGACLESGICESFSIFGLSDARSWYDQPEPGEERASVNYSEPLPFDINYNPKPTYYALLNTLSEHCE